MRIGLVTPWDERCGLSEYAKHLIAHTDSDCKYRIEEACYSSGTVTYTIVPSSRTR